MFAPARRCGAGKTTLCNLVARFYDSTAGAHRMSTIALADRIAVLDEGELIAVGPHHELMATSDLYRRMVELQTLDTSSFGKVTRVEHESDRPADELIVRP